MSEKDCLKLSYDPIMCAVQFADTMGFVERMLADPRIDGASAEAGRRCEELVDGLYESGDRTAYLAMLGCLAMDIAANVSYTLDRARLWRDCEEMGGEE